MRISLYAGLIGSVLVCGGALAQAPSITGPATQAPARPAIGATSRSSPAVTQPGDGPGQVWVNANSKVYHCSGDKYYGKTKHGSFMNEADAKAKGFHADRGKTCG